MEIFFCGKEQERDIYSSEVTNIPLLFLGRVRNFFWFWGCSWSGEGKRAAKFFREGKEVRKQERRVKQDGKNGRRQRRQAGAKRLERQMTAGSKGIGEGGGTFLSVYRAGEKTDEYCQKMA